MTDNDFTNSENEKRFHIINGAGNLVKYGIFCKPVLVDEETGKQYVSALDLTDLLNDLHEDKKANEHLLRVYTDFLKVEGYNITDIIDFCQKEVSKELIPQLRGDKSIL